MGSSGGHDDGDYGGAGLIDPLEATMGSGISDEAPDACDEYVVCPNVDG